MISLDLAYMSRYNNENSTTRIPLCRNSTGTHISGYKSQREMIVLMNIFLMDIYLRYVSECLSARFSSWQSGLVRHSRKNRPLVMPRPPNGRPWGFRVCVGRRTLSPRSQNTMSYPKER